MQLEGDDDSRTQTVFHDCIQSAHVVSSYFAHVLTRRSVYSRAASIHGNTVSPMNLIIKCKKPCIVHREQDFCNLLYSQTEKMTPYISQCFLPMKKCQSPPECICVVRAERLTTGEHLSCWLD